MTVFLQTLGWFAAVLALMNICRCLYHGWKDLTEGALDTEEMAQKWFVVSALFFIAYGAIR